MSDAGLNATSFDLISEGGRGTMVAYEEARGGEIETIIWEDGLSSTRQANAVAEVDSTDGSSCV